MTPDAARTLTFCQDLWDRTVVPTLVDYIRIPNKSPAFDPDWAAAGHMEAATQLIAGWCRDHALPDMTIEIVRLEGRTPVIFMEAPAVGGAPGTVLLYGHLDKQPEMTGWDEAAGLGPWTPVIQGERLYGRGGADDGYAAFASLGALRALAEQDTPRPRCVILIEACEESGSFDLPPYIDHLSERIGTPDLVVCLDSGCGDYERLWMTTSLRGMVIVDLRVEVLTEGVHSGDAGGVVPETFRVLRRLLDRIEDADTGVLTLPEMSVAIPDDRRRQAAAAGAVLGDTTWDKFPFVDGAQALATDPVELVLNRTWRPSLAVTGIDGMPAIVDAGNVLRPFTAAKLSMRLPPTADPEAASAALRRALTSDPPHGVKVSFESEVASGWNAPALAPWLEAAVGQASQRHFGQDAAAMGEGGSIPFMAMLGERYPAAQFLITGVLGPGSNAHGPNEFLDIPTGKRLTACVADVLAALGAG